MYLTFTPRVFLNRIRLIRLTHVIVLRLMRVMTPMRYVVRVSVLVRRIMATPRRLVLPRMRLVACRCR